MTLSCAQSSTAAEKASSFSAFSAASRTLNPDAIKDAYFAQIAADDAQNASDDESGSDSDSLNNTLSKVTISGRTNIPRRLER